ncbi:MAG: ATP-binding protein [Chlorobium sp.]|nr:ATP-binding protein [Chlorobium sp.]
MPSFFSYNALISQRASGYKNTTHAIAEIIDNSFDANASEVRVIFLETQDAGRKHISEILISDNGDGMSPDILQGALQFGNTTNTDIATMVAQKKKGKFGYGLPNASLSQCPCFHIFSWQAENDFKTTYLDLEELHNKNSIDIPGVVDASIPRYYDGIGAVINSHKGTIVSWRKCDRLSNTRADTIIEKSLERLGRLFRYSLGQGRKISFHQYRYDTARAHYVQSELPQIVIPNDPLFLMENTLIADALWNEASVNNGTVSSARTPAVCYQGFSSSKTKCSPTNHRFEDHCYTIHFDWQGKQYLFEIITSIADIDIQKPGMREGGQTQVGKFYGRKAKDGNISFVRADREITAGHFGFHALTDARHRWWSIEIKFNADSDDLLGVHNNKQGIEFVFTREIDREDEWNPYTAELLQAKEQLWQFLTIKISEAVKKVFAQVKKKHKEWDLQNTAPGDDPNSGEPGGLPGSTPRTEEVIKETEGERPGQFTDEQIIQLSNRLKQKFPSIPEGNINTAIERYDRARVRGCILYSESESEQLWSFSTVYDFLIITINTRHEFYQNILHPLRMANQEEALSAIELFISSLAWEEHTHFRKPQEQEILENFRSYVGIHLNRYIKDIRLDESSFASSANDEVEEDAV